MTSILDYISTWSVLKWVILVLLAGFIGQFGKIMAEAIIMKVRRRREIKQAKVNTEPLETQNILLAHEETSAPPAASGEIPDKKRLKALVKASKKENKKQ